MIETRSVSKLMRFSRRVCCALFAFFVILCFSALAQSDVNEWPLHGYESSETRYSPLKSIHTKNVKDLGLAWEFTDFSVRGRTHRGNEATPIMVGGVLYFTGPWSVVYAVDAETGKRLWEYDPEVPGQWARKACCDVVNRGVAVKDSRLYVGTTHGFLDAIDIQNGERIWRVDTLIDRSRAYTITGAPRLAGDKIVIGNGGAELGVRGYVSAYDLNDGTLAWRFFTVPGSPDKPDEHIEVTQARKTWGVETKWDFGLGGTVWDSMTYDPELDWIYVGVGNGSPWPAWSRSPGGQDHLFLTSILAIDMETGRLQWHYQTTPGDSWDYTATQHMILADVEIKGRERKVLMQAPKNGFFYVLDREDGELLSAKPYTHVTWAKTVDLETGRPILTENANYSEHPKTVSPSMAGGHNWQPMAYNKDEGLVYIPTMEMPVEFQMDDRENFVPDSINANVRINMNPPKDEENWTFRETLLALPKSILKAWDPIENKEVWRSYPHTWWDGGVLTTAGGLVVQGGMDGGVSIYDAHTGEVLHKIMTGTPIMAAPITYKIGDTQYIAVLAGFGGSLKAYPQGSAAAKYENAERLLVFKLGGKDVPMPPLKPAQELQALHPQTSFDIKLAKEGQELFLDYCAQCHAYRGVPNGYPNLWNLVPDMYDNFDVFVLDGVAAYAGMPKFDDVLTQEHVRAIREFLLYDESRFRGVTDHD